MGGLRSNNEGKKSVGTTFPFSPPHPPPPGAPSGKGCVANGLMTYGKQTHERAFRHKLEELSTPPKKLSSCNLTVKRVV